MVQLLALPGFTDMSPIGEGEWHNMGAMVGLYLVPVPTDRQHSSHCRKGFIKMCKEEEMRGRANH